MKITIEINATGEAFDMHPFSELASILKWVPNKVRTQLTRPDALCKHPEIADILKDTNGNTVGSVKVEKEQMPKLAGFELSTLLEISTGHMSVRDNNMLYASELVTYTLGLGTLVWVGNEDYDAAKVAKSAGMSEAFQSILEFARENGIRWVKFDRDGPSYAHFEAFVW